MISTFRLSIGFTNSMTITSPFSTFPFVYTACPSPTPQPASSVPHPSNGRILIPDAAAIPLEEDEYYTRDLYGMQVVTEDGEALGELVKIYETGANDVYAVKCPNGKEVLLPVIDECILDVDLERQQVTAHIMPGLVD